MPREIKTAERRVNLIPKITKYMVLRKKIAQ